MRIKIKYSFNCDDIKFMLPNKNNVQGAKLIVKENRGRKFLKSMD